MNSLLKLIKIRNYSNVVERLLLSMRRDGLPSTFKRIFLYIIRRIQYTLAIFISPFIVYFFPKYINCLSLSIPPSQSLPNFNNRIIKKTSLLEDFDFCRLDPIPQFDEINLVMRGKSLNLNMINKNLPTFFLNVKEGQNYPDFHNKWLATADDNIFRSYLGLFGNEGWNGYKVKKSDEKVFFIYTNRFMFEIDPNRKNWSSSCKSDLRSVLSS